jgi:hypothetical protein
MEEALWQFLGLVALLIILWYFGRGIYALLSKQYIQGVHDKTFVYLCAEYSYSSERSSERSTRLIEMVNREAPGRIKVPIGDTWAGITKPLFEKLANLGKGFLVFVILAMIVAGVYMVLRNNALVEQIGSMNPKELNRVYGTLFIALMLLLFLGVFFAYSHA